MTNFKMIVGATALALVTACTTPQASLGPVSSTGFTAVQNVPMDSVTIKAGVDFSTYSKIYISPVSLDFIQETEDYQLTDKDRTDLQASIQSIFERELAEKGHLSVVDHVSSGALELKLTVTNFDLVVSEKSVNSMRSEVFAFSPGKIAIQGVLLDSITGDVFATFSDEREPRSATIERVTRSSVKADFRWVIKRWAKTMNDVFFISPAK